MNGRAAWVARDGLLAVLVLLTALGCLGAASALRDPRAACESHLPWFEGFVVVDARASWRPPLLRCVAEDRDPPQLGERYAFTAWGTRSVMGLGALTVMTAVLTTWRLTSARGVRRAARPPS